MDAICISRKMSVVVTIDFVFAEFIYGVSAGFAQEELGDRAEATARTGVPAGSPMSIA